MLLVMLMTSAESHHDTMCHHKRHALMDLLVFSRRKHDPR